MWEGGVDGGVQLAGRSARLFLHTGSALSSSPPHRPSARSHCVCSSSVRQQCVDRLLDLHAAAMHLDDLGSEGLDGSQDQLLVLEGSDAKAQYISVDKKH